MSYDRRRPDDLEELKRLLRDRLEDVAVRVLGEPTSRGRREWRWGRKGGRSLIIETHGRLRRGTYTAFDGSGLGGSELDMLMDGLGIDLAGAIRWARTDCGLAPGMSLPTPSPEILSKREHEKARRVAEAAKAEAEAIQAARQIFAATVPLVGTPGETYFRQTRCIDVAELPSVARWSPERRAVVLAATVETGELEAVQLIHVDEDGRKLTDQAVLTSLRSPAPKWTRGILTRGALVRIPGAPNSPVQVTEGPETGLSVWAATGYETWVALGGLARVVPPVGRLVVICRDDDPNASAGAHATRRAVTAMREAGASLVVATPWAVRRFDKSDFNTLAQEEGIAAVGARLGAIIEAPARIMRPQLSAEVASKIVRNAIDKHFSDLHEWNYEDGEALPPVHVIRATVGVSKSAAMRSSVLEFLRHLRASGDTRNVAIAVPSHRLGAEAEVLLRELAGAEFLVQVWRGYGADDPERPGHKMCEDLSAVGDALAAGARVEESCCSYKPKGKERLRCPFFDECGSQRQKSYRASIWIVAHEMLFRMKPKALGELAAVVVDEAAWQDGLEGVGFRVEDGVEKHLPRMTLSLDALTESDRRPGETEHDPDWRTIAYRRGYVFDALRDHPLGPVHRNALEEISQGAALEVRGLELCRLKKDTGLRPGMSRKERTALVEAASDNRVILSRARLFDAVAALRADDGPDRSGLVAVAMVAGPHGPQRVLYLKGRSDVGTGWRVPTLILDANADLELLRPFWPNAEMIVDLEAAAPFQRIRQVTDCSYAKNKLTPVSDGLARERGDIAKSRNAKARAARDTIVREARETSSGRMLAVAQASVERAIIDLGLRAGVETAHHNNIAGMDCWRDIERQVVFGRTMPRPSAVERMAEALTGAAVDPVGGYERRDAWRLVRGCLVACQADRHPHPIAEKIRWQVCEGELIQIIGRPRGIWRTESNPVDILLATDVPLPVNIDEEISAASLAPSPIDEMLGAGGIAFTNCAHASTAYPGVWAKPKDAENAFRRWRTPSTPDESTTHPGMRESSWQVRVRYQVRGAGQKLTEAVVDRVVHPDARAAVEAALKDLGALARFEIVGAADGRIVVPNVVPQAPDRSGHSTSPLPAAVSPSPVEPNSEGGAKDIDWLPGPSYFEPALGSSEGDRAIIAFAAELPWRLQLPPSTAGPKGWVRA